MKFYSNAKAGQTIVFSGVALCAGGGILISTIFIHMMKEVEMLLNITDSNNLMFYDLKRHCGT